MVEHAFFAATPWEVDQFYQQYVLKKKNVQFYSYPIGTGPYQLTINNPNREMRLERNPYFGGEVYPNEGMPGDQAKGLLALANQPLPFIDAIHFKLEKESIPRWVKFMQGYYDRAVVGSDSFDQAIQLQPDGHAILSPSLQKKMIQLESEISPSIFYFGFNFLNKKVGGYSKKQAYLRQAISIAIDMEEFISIFKNGQGTVAHGPIPPGILGANSVAYNPYVYTQDPRGQIVRQSIEQAKRLLAQAGYFNGIDPQTGRRLRLHLDITGSQGPDDKAQFDWYRKQFKKLNIDLVIRATQYNRFQQKLRNGSAEIYFSGWSADYPDPENFLFILYGPNAKVLFQGENASNYQRAAFDENFKKLLNPKYASMRSNLIQKMVAQVQFDAPWIFGFHPKTFLLSHQWLAPTKLNELINNSFKYQKIDQKRRVSLQHAWNQPVVYFLGILIFLSGVVVMALQSEIKRKEFSNDSLLN